MNKEYQVNNEELLRLPTRQLELDIAKGIAIICMIAVHVQSSLSVNAIIHSNAGGIIELLGTLPAAPVFMFLLGTGVVYSRNNSLKKSIDRGLRIFALGYVLNILRTVIIFFPSLLSGEWVNQTGFIIKSLLTIDILQFAGLAIICVGLVKKSGIGIYIILTLTVFLASTNYILLSFQTKNDYIGAVTGLFWGSWEWASFPLITWIFYPMTGYCFGILLKNAQSKKIFYKKSLLLSSIAFMLLAFLTFIFKIDTGLMSEVSYAHHTLYNNFLYTSFIIVWISILFYTSKVLPEVVTNMLVQWSKNVNSMYIIHWVLIALLIAVFGMNNLGLLTTIIIFLTICVASDFLAKYYKKRKKNLVN